MPCTWCACLLLQQDRALPTGHPSMCWHTFRAVTVHEKQTQMKSCLKGTNVQSAHTHSRMIPAAWQLAGQWKTPPESCFAQSVGEWRGLMGWKGPQIRCLLPAHLSGGHSPAFRCRLPWHTAHVTPSAKPTATSTGILKMLTPHLRRDCQSPCKRELKSVQGVLHGVMLGWQLEQCMSTCSSQQ